jgi:hypothetical protein
MQPKSYLAIQSHMSTRYVSRQIIVTNVEQRPRVSTVLRYFNRIQCVVVLLRMQSVSSPSLILPDLEIVTEDDPGRSDQAAQPKYQLGQFV